MKYALGVVIFLFLMTFPAWWITGGGQMNAVIQFIHMPSLMFFLFAITAVIIITGEYKTYIKAVNAVLSKKYKISNPDKEKAIRLFGLLLKTVNYTILVMTVTPIVLMLGNLDDPSMLGPMFSVSLLVPLYGFLINLIFIHPAIYILKSRLNTESPPVISEKQVVDKLLEMCYRQGISPEEVLNADEISFRTGTGGKN